VLQEGPRAHDLVLAGTTKAFSGTEPDLVMESLQLREIVTLVISTPLSDQRTLKVISTTSPSF